MVGRVASQHPLASRMDHTYVQTAPPGHLVELGGLVDDAHGDPVLRKRECCHQPGRASSNLGETCESMHPVMLVIEVLTIRIGRAVGAMMTTL